MPRVGARPRSRHRRQGTHPLRVFIRSGPKSHGPGAHDYPRFLKEWVPLLNERGAKATGARRVSDQGPARRDRRPHPPRAGGGQHHEPADRKNLNDFLARGGGLVVIHAGVGLAAIPTGSRAIVGGSWRERHDEVARRPDAPLLHRPRQSDHEGRRRTGRWTTRSTTTWTSCPRPASSRRPTRRSRRAGNANAQRRADELTGGGKRVSIYDIQPQMWTYERTVDGGTHAVSRVRLDPRTSLRELQPPELPRDPPARDRVGRQARERRRAPEEGRARRRPALRRRRTDGARQGRREDRGASGVRPDARRRRAAHPQGDEHRLGRAGPAVGLGNARVSQRPPRAEHRRRGRTAARSARQQDRDPEDTISILTDTNGDGVMDRKHVFADKLELVTGFVLLQGRRHRRDVAGHLVSRGHQRRRGRRQAHEALHRPRHRRHARRHQQPALGPRRLDLRHARLQRRRR